MLHRFHLCLYVVALGDKFFDFDPLVPLMLFTWLYCVSLIMLKYNDDIKTVPCEMKRNDWMTLREAFKKQNGK